MKKIIFSCFIITLITSKTVLAYIDPGTGSVVASSIWPLIVAVFSAIGGFLIKYFWSPIKGFFGLNKDGEK
jgi:hypothetical protein